MAEVDFSANAHFVSARPTAPALRIGVLVPDRRLPRFARRVLEDLATCQFAHVTCLINDADPDAAAMAFSRSGSDSISMQAYLRHVDARYRLDPDPLDLVDCDDVLSSLEDPEHGRSNGGAKPAPVDVYLCLGSRDAARRIDAPARYGTWALEFGTDASRGDNVPPAMLEVMQELKVSTIGLERIDEGHERELVKRMAISTTPAPSLSENQFNVYWAAPHLVIQALYELHNRGEVPQIRRTDNERRPPVTTDNISIARWMAPLMVRKTLRRLSPFRAPPPRWRLGVRRSATPLYQTPGPEAVRQFAWLDPPPAHFWADPFLLEQDGKTWLFYEDYSYHNARGTLACGWLDSDGRLREARTILDRPYHLSYPHVFEHDGAVWMVPESEQSRRVELYRATRFPDEWTLERTLLDLRGVDATPFEHDGSWWMFVSPMITAGNFPATLLFRAPTLMGPWTLHPSSPVSADVRHARCGGKVFREGNKLIRPSQNCGPSYGYSLTFNEIERLNELEYAERPTATLLPEWIEDTDGLHTFNRAGEWEVIDCKSVQANGIANGSDPDR